MATNYSIRICRYCKQSFHPKARNQPYCSAYCRFLIGVQIAPENKCWMWKKGYFPSGYGQFNLNRKPLTAHRAIWRLIHGPIPKGLLVCHQCDNRGCVNPNHLFLGTPQDNIVDMYNKNRAVDNRGVKNGQSKLTNEDILNIREQIKAGVFQHIIAKRFNIDQSAISCINTQKRWKHVISH